MKTKKSSFLSLICSGMCSGAIAIAMIPTLPANSQIADNPSPPPASVLKALNLSDSQKQQIESILQKGKESRRTAMEELREKERELRGMMDGTATREVLTQKFNQIQNLRRQNEQRRFEQMLAIREILTPQQRSQLSKAASEARGNWRERRERRFAKPDDQL
ncbi:hypothetical protein Syn7502_01999 [Synechococcus sp. PCC 7502]|uniref:Spy/CpxP family protein refolding chaperone n=1 Tax=Synechococcus sp. PCC 7502 TaxID=1173263 RepID=UPI00029F8BA9|nr:Spy/CpxP family protein refolding chaperone [Synechococcus sp. PCC 7502]AFY74025.1 hypothetical protein Syn7502_01999 [Synechococcus sp. PCC 7502]